MSSSRVRGARRFLTPGWVLGACAVVAFAYLCFTVLAPWQLGKSDRLDERNQQLSDSVSAAPAPLAQVADSPTAFADRQWRLVTADGSFVPGTRVLLRLRSVDGTPAFHVLEAFHPVSGDDLLVDRGWVPIGENNTVPPLPAAPAGAVTITARLRDGEHGALEPIDLGGNRAVRVLDLAELSHLVGHPLDERGYLQLSGEQPGVLTPLPIPDIETGPYLSYGLQWIAFGVFAPLALGYFAWIELSARRRSGTSAADGPPPATDVAVIPETAVPQDDANAVSRPAPTTPVADPMAARYGDRFEAERRRARRRRDRLSGD